MNHTFTTKRKARRRPPKCVCGKTKVRYDCGFKCRDCNNKKRRAKEAKLKEARDIRKCVNYFDDLGL